MQYVFGIVCFIYMLLYVMSKKTSGKTPLDKMAIYVIHLSRKVFPPKDSTYKKSLSEILQRLNPAERPDILFDNYQTEKYRLLLIVFFAGTLFAFCISVVSPKESTLFDENKLVKNSYPDGNKTVTLMAKTPEAGNEMQIDVEIAERIYTSEELDEMFSLATKEMINLIVQENKSLNEVQTSLYLMDEISPYPFAISWKINDSAYMDTSGQLKEQILEEGGVPLELTAVFSYENYEREYIVSVRLLPIEKTPLEEWKQQLEQEVQKAIEISKHEKNIQLPKEVDGGQIIWTEKREDNGKIFFFLLLLVMAMIFYFQDKDLEKKLSEKDFEMELEYAGIIHKLALYLGSGMTVRSSIAKIATDYETKKKRDGIFRYAFEEILILYQEMNRGITELVAYENFGKRCRLQMYIKLATLLSQSAKKGNDNLILQLRKEADEVMENRKNLALKLGEEAGTKLLFPMLLMMGIVMVLIIVPAFLSF